MIQRFLVTSVFIWFSLSLSSESLASDWWFNPPEDTPDYLYGLGEGFGMQQARQAALSDIAGKLSTQLSSSLNRLAQENDGRFSESIRQEISSQTTDVELSQFQVIQSYQTRDNRTRTLVRLERQRLAAIWKQRIDEHVDRVLPIIERNSISTTQEWRETYLILPYALEARNLSYQLFALTGEPIGPDLHRALTSTFENHTVSIGVVGSNHVLTTAIQTALRQLGINICQQNCRSAVSYSIRAEGLQAFGEHVAHVNLELTLSEHGTKQSSIQISTQAVSMSSETLALRSATRQLNTQISTRLVELLKI